MTSSLRTELESAGLSVGLRCVAMPNFSIETLCLWRVELPPTFAVEQAGNLVLTAKIFRPSVERLLRGIDYPKDTILQLAKIASRMTEYSTPFAKLSVNQENSDIEAIISIELADYDGDTVIAEHLKSLTQVQVLFQRFLAGELTDAEITDIAINAMDPDSLAEYRSK